MSSVQVLQPNQHFNFFLINKFQQIQQEWKLLNIHF